MDQAAHNETSSRRTKMVASGTIVIGIVVLGLKLLAWRMTNSTALFSDAMESIVNVAASLMAFAALVYAQRPADDNHPYGHGKIEFFAAVGEGALILVAAMAIFQEAWHAIQQPRILLDAPFSGIALNGAATMLNGLWGWRLMKTARRTHSPSLKADASHLLNDVVSSSGVVAGLLGAWLVGQPILDPLLAGLVAVYILWSGFRLIRESVGGLMDEAPTPDVLERIRSVVSLHAEGALEAHDLRTRRSGQRTFLQFHLVVPGDMTVSEAHTICDKVEAALQAEIAHLVTTIHVEPDSKAKHNGILVL
ncbi:cation diffusion facilitator family transporter [Granulibacter bethesdensis]|uniref:Protein p34 n=1 Tax=Granulibacter bethesdensis (strain ATCC BAA-1260 / CGDNIH1) TaxID=391165 RepID=Q0BW07_GRABC|nr:cation diffusion facilitator family transporter [Granulibacter bethesdensis]ABI60995.1 Cobalt-zinc-cadmium resistance protein czcD [Granulibacter bethesdensis CGDNIH1]AHJ64464.1 Cobalt-zinc-cadmium resistance protein czcD [Granulibacter bethesdensis CGDNIH4]AHJ67081.1 Cobalt-zinc-cadmium resistance protein czcD [Granulibacter bethesdensis]APH50765.1 Cobalt-zinc-cadmium resistance protein czcD [Granulibacter bethesdensis]APH58385.1 Cobalt-zinc-cadmium resistance protein czcD [Granulibacter b